VLCGSFLGKAVMGRLLKELVGAMARSEVLVKVHFKTATCPWWRSPLEPDWMDELLGDVMGEYEGQMKGNVVVKKGGTEFRFTYDADHVGSRTVSGVV
jgi:hypothetical protein